MKVQLKRWTMDDQERLQAIMSQVDRSYLSNRLPDHYTLEDAAWWIGMAREKDGKEGVFRAIWLDGQCVGNISVEKKSDVYERDGEIGYMVREEAQGKGVMTEAVRLICQEAFDILKLERITGMVYAPHEASRQILRKNGFDLEGILRRGVCKHGQVYDLCIYGKVKPMERKKPSE